MLDNQNVHPKRPQNFLQTGDWLYEWYHSNQDELLPKIDRWLSANLKGHCYQERLIPWGGVGLVMDTGISSHTGIWVQVSQEQEWVWNFYPVTFLYPFGQVMGLWWVWSGVTCRRCRCFQHSQSSPHHHLTDSTESLRRQGWGMGCCAHPLNR